MNRFRFYRKTKCRAERCQAGRRNVLYFWLLWMALTLLCAMPSFALAEKPLIKDVRLEKISAQEVRAFISLTGLCLPEIFPIEGRKLRLVCDFPDAGMSDGIQRPIACDGKIVESVRIGVHNSPESKIRLVFDLSSDHAYNVDQVYSQQENVLMIIIRQNEKE